jgi:hypothetical protein
MERLRVEITSALVSSEETLANSNQADDQDRLVHIRDAIAALTERGDFPLPHLTQASLQSRVDKARSNHRRALQRCVRDLSRVEESEELPRVQAELDDFELEPAGLYERMSRMPPTEQSVQVLGNSRGTGTWLVESGALVCPAGGIIAFGDLEWTDYDVIVTVRADEEEPKELSILGRFDRDQQAWELNAGGWGLSNRDLRPQVHGDPVWYKSPHRVWMEGAQPTEPGDTYTLGLSFRGTSATVLLDGEESRIGVHPSLTKGRVAIHTKGASAFLDVEVRDPEGRLLWKGLPDIQ